MKKATINTIAETVLKRLAESSTDKLKRTLALRAKRYGKLDDPKGWDNIERRFKHIGKLNDIARIRANKRPLMLKGNNLTHILSPSTSEKGGWRVTSFTKDMQPLGHSEFRNYEAGLKELLSQDISGKADILFEASAMKAWNQAARDHSSIIFLFDARSGKILSGNSQNTRHADLIKDMIKQNPEVDINRLWRGYYIPSSSMLYVYPVDSLTRTVAPTRSIILDIQSKLGIRNPEVEVIECKGATHVESKRKNNTRFGYRSE